MKKDMYTIIGIAALIITLVIVGSWQFNKSKPSSSSNSAQVVDLKTPDNPSLGPSMARVNIIEFLDPECEACRAMHPIVKRLLKEFEGRVFYQIRYFPLHKNSAHSAAMLEATRAQNKYWEALDILMERQPEWADHHLPKPELIPEILKEIGVDAEQLIEESQKPEIVQRIERDKNKAMSLNLRGTPTFFINGVEVERLGYEPLKSAIEAAFK